MSQTTLPERVLEWTQKYCDSLTENYKQHSVRMHENYTSDWSKQQLESIKNGTANLTNFVIKNGRKYYKIMQREFDTFQLLFRVVRVRTLIHSYTMLFIIFSQRITIFLCPFQNSFR